MYFILEFTDIANIIPMIEFSFGCSWINSADELFPINVSLVQLILRNTISIKLLLGPLQSSEIE